MTDRSNEVDDRPCENCGVQYQGLGAVWTTDSHLWNEVVGGDPNVEASGVLCPTCFCILALASSGIDAIWRLSIERSAVRHPWNVVSAPLSGSTGDET